MEGQRKATLLETVDALVDEKGVDCVLGGP